VARRGTLALLVSLAVGCAPPNLRLSLDREIESPAPPGSGEPNLAQAPDGRALLTWVEAHAAGGHALRFATLDPGGGWSPPRTIAAGSNWFINWADFPSLTPLPDGRLAAHWLARSGNGTYDYDVQLSLSTDGGDSWSAPVSPHPSGGGEHGFVSLVPAGDGGVDVIWLDGRNLEAGGATQLRHARLGADGRPGAETVLDDRVCDCCQTSAARTGADLILVYRDRSAEEIRDISWVRHRRGRWEEPRPLSHDGWKIHGCPVNGPAVDADGDRVAVAWFTAPADKTAVRLTFSADGGSSWRGPITVDDGRPLGRVDVAVAPGGGVFVSWMESSGDSAEVRVRYVGEDGRREPPVTVASSSAERASGFPRLLRSGRSLVVAWTDPADPPRVRAALLAY
jgi:hypothetical protein